MSEIVTKVDVTDPDGILLNTGGRYCRHPILALPRLRSLEVNENGTYPIPRGFAGYGQVKVAVTPKQESALLVTENGTYQAPEGSVYTSVTVRVVNAQAGDHTCEYAATVYPATCETEGFTRHTCTVCGKHYDSDKIPPTGHTYRNGSCTVCGKADPNLPQGGITSGFTLTEGEHFTLTYSGEAPQIDAPANLTFTDGGGILVFTATAAGTGTLFLRRGEVVLATYQIVVRSKAESETHTHTYSSTVTHPTCTESGYTTHTCACGASYRDSEKAALGHDWGEPYYSSSFSTGYGHVCERCGKTESLDSPEHSHDYTFARTVSPTCTSGGYDIYSCTCGETVHRNATSKLGHSYTSQTVAPTCEGYGFTKYTCSRCGHVYTDNETEPNGHSWGTPFYDSRFSTGYGYACTVCGKLQSLTPPAHVHSYTHLETVAATCEHGGYDIYFCTCGATETRNETPALGHKYTPTVIPATCTEGGYTRYTCARCGDSYVGDETDPNGHNFSGGWVTVTAPTCTHRGSEKRTCLTCGHSETREVAALGHDWGNPEYDDSFSSGQSVTCERCGVTEEY